MFIFPAFLADQYWNHRPLWPVNFYHWYCVLQMIENIHCNLSCCNNPTGLALCRPIFHGCVSEVVVLSCSIGCFSYITGKLFHDDVIKWKHFPRYWPFVLEFTGPRWIPLTKASDAELWCFLWSAPWINSWVNNREVGDLRRHRAHYDVIVMFCFRCCCAA